jgi:hypothetical protein
VVAVSLASKPASRRSGETVPIFIVVILLNR